MLPQKRRIDKNSFKKLFKEGKTISSRFFSLKILNTGASFSRFSVVVPVSVEKKAAKRNKFKRQGRSILAKNTDKIKNGVDVAIFLKKEAKELGFTEMDRELSSFLKKSGLLNK